MELFESMAHLLRVVLQRSALCGAHIAYLGTVSGGVHSAFLAGVVAACRQFLQLDFMVGLGRSSRGDGGLTSQDVGTLSLTD